MKQKLIFLIPAILLLGFLAFKPPAIGSEKGDVIVTPEATVTPSTKPQLRDFDGDGDEPEHFEDHRKREESERHNDGDENRIRDHHEGEDEHGHDDEEDDD